MKDARLAAAPWPALLAVSLAWAIGAIVAVDPGADGLTTYAAALPVVRVSDAVAGLALVLAGGLAYAQPRGQRLGLLVLLGLLAWFGADWEGAEDAPGLLRFVADPNAVSPLERTVDRELKEKVESTLRVLNSREEEIVRLRFGIGREMPYTLEEIGRVMGLSRERVRQIEATALKKIQSAGECKDLKEFLA